MSLIAVLVAGCSFVDTIDPRYDTINRSTTKARNESILLNIVRASQNVPLNFVTFSRVSGSTQANLGMAAPTFVLGANPPPATIQRDATISNSTLNTSVLAASSFDITVLESRDFYTALLSPVDLPTLNFFVRQGYSRDLLFWLFTDSVRETIGGTTVEYRNTPDPQCPVFQGTQRCFEKMVDDALATGLTVETLTEQHLPTPGPGMLGAPGGTGPPGMSPLQRPINIVYSRLCFDPVLATRSLAEYPPDIQSSLRWPGQHQPRCGNWKPDKKKLGGDTLTFEWVGTPYGTIKYEIITRSTFGIYQFLGRILSRGLTNAVRVRGPRDGSEDTRILAVAQDRSDGCFVEINYEGEMFCVPQKSAESTKRIFSILVQLLALKTQVGDLAITPTVRVAP